MPVDCVRFDVTDSGGFAAGQSRAATFSENAGFQWFGKALSVSVMPFDASNQNRAIEITQVVHRSTGSNLNRTVEITYRNTGVDTIIIYYIVLGIIRE